MSFDNKIPFDEVYGFSENQYKERRESLNKLCLKNVDLPHCNYDEFENLRGIYSANDFGNTPTVFVPTDKIIASSTLTNWGDVDNFREPNSFDRLWKIYESMPKTGFQKDEPLFLYDYGGIFVVNCGQRRTMIAKALDVPEVAAKVIKVYPTEVIIPSSTEFDRLSLEQEQQKWLGEMEFRLDSNGVYSGGSATIQKYEGLWQFMKHPEKMKEIYKSVGASGQAELFI